jgi:hyperosmotically inducible periplasmic protein
MKQCLLCCLCLAVLGLPGCGGGMGIHPAAATAATDDASISARVKAMLLNDTQVRATNIDVSTVNGVVTIAGRVSSKAEEARAIQLAHQVTGVRDVKSTLQVSPGAETGSPFL